MNAMTKTGTIYVNRFYAGGQMAPACGVLSRVATAAGDDRHNVYPLEVRQSTEFRDWMVIICIPIIKFKRRITNAGGGNYASQIRILGIWTKPRVYMVTSTF